MKCVKDEHEATEPKTTHGDKVKVFPTGVMTVLRYFDTDETDKIENDDYSFQNARNRLNVEFVEADLGRHHCRGSGGRLCRLD